MNRSQSAFSLVVCVIALPGCWSRSPEPSPSSMEEATNLDASEILTKQDAEAIMGKPIENPEVSGAGTTVSTCNYYAADSSGIGLLVRSAADSDSARIIFEQARSQSKTTSSVEPQQIPGLGDQAYWAGGNLNQMNILEGKYWLIFTVFSGKDRSLELAKQAAEKAIARLQSLEPLAFST